MSASTLPSYGRDEDLPAPRPDPGGLSGLQVLGAVSAGYALLGACGNAASFTAVAFGPALLGVGGVRPPAPPIELRWFLALSAIFGFALSIMLLIAGFATMARQQRGALMLGLWSVCAIVVHAVFLAWEFTLLDDMTLYHAQVAEAQRHALAAGGVTPRPFGDYESLFTLSDRLGRHLRSIPFIYPAIVGVLLLLPPSRRRIASWN